MGSHKSNVTITESTLYTDHHDPMLDLLLVVVVLLGYQFGSKSLNDSPLFVQASVIVSLSLLTASVADALPIRLISDLSTVYNGLLWLICLMIAWLPVSMLQSMCTSTKNDRYVLPTARGQVHKRKVSAWQKYSSLLVSLVLSFIVYLLDLRSFLVTISLQAGLYLAATLNGVGSVVFPLQSVRGCLLRPVSMDSLQMVHRERQQLMQARADPALLQELDAEMAEMQRAMQLAAHAQTTRGKIESVLGVVFSIVLVVRLVLAVRSVGMDRPPEDPVTTILLHLLGADHERYNAISQATSLVLSIVLGASQMRNFVRIVGHVQKRLQSTVFEHVWSTALLCYTLAGCILTKQLLPASYSSSLSNVVETDVSFPQTWFVGTALVSTAVMMVTVGIQRSNTVRYQRTR